MQAQTLPTTTPTWRERLAELGIRSFDTKARRKNPIKFLLRVLGLSLTEASLQLMCPPDALGLLVRGEADTVIDEVREGLRRQGLDDQEIFEWYLDWLEHERVRARWA